MTWCILLHTYTYESRSRTPKRIRIYSVIYYIIHIQIITMQRFLKEEDSLAAILPPIRPRVFFSLETHPKTFGLQCLIFSHRFSLLFGCFETPLSGKKKQTKNMQHRSSNADTIRSESEKVRQANEERLREKRMVRCRLISFFL